MLQEGGSLPGLKNGLLPNTGNEVSEETHLPTKQQTLLGRHSRAESSRMREPRRTVLPFAELLWFTVLGFMVVGLVSRSSLANHSDSVLPGGARIAQPR